MGSKTSGDRDSIKSGGSHSRKNSVNAAETPGITRTVSKEAHKLHGKTDPNAAINEAQPCKSRNLEYHCRLTDNS